MSPIAENLFDVAVGDILVVGDRFAQGAGMQDVDCPTDIKALSEPPGAGRSRVEVEALRVVTRS